MPSSYRPLRARSNAESAEVRRATARAEASTEQLERIDVREAVAERVAAWQPVADGNGVKLVTDPAAPAGPAGLRVALGTGHLEQILDNLLDNAGKYSPEGSTVQVALRGGELLIRDHGPGIPAADRPHVFDRFYRGATARAVPGTGLGLAIVRQTAELHGGTVRAANADDGGAVFVLELPAR